MESPSSAARRRRKAIGASLALALSMTSACAEPSVAPFRAAGPGVRPAPDDSDPVAVIPAGTEILLEVDVAALRRSPWTRPALFSTGADERAARSALQGFDEINDVDRLGLGVTPQSAGSTLMVAQGRFEADRVLAAFRAGDPGRPHAETRESSWRGIQVWSAGERSLALLTPRTLLAGPLAAVRAAIDCAFGVVRDVRADAEMGALRRAVEGPSGRSAARILVLVTEEMRARIAAEKWAAPPGLKKFAARVDLGRDLEVEAVGILDSARDAETLTLEVQAGLQDLRKRRVLMGLGLASFLEGVRVAAQGSRVVGSLRLSEDRRDELAEKLTAIGILMRTARASAGPAQTP